MEQKLSEIIARFQQTPYTDSDYWFKVSTIFKVFWKEKVLNDVYQFHKNRAIDDLDPIIRLLDINGLRKYEFKNLREKETLRNRLLESGNKYGMEYEISEITRKGRDYLQITNIEGLAKTLVRQDKWHQMFYDLKSDTELRQTLDAIFNEEELQKKAQLLDKLRELNDKYKNSMTGTSANGIGALLSLHSPEMFLQIVSLGHRKKMISAFELGEISEQESYGNQIIKTNQLLLSFNNKYDTNKSPLELSFFFYQDDVRPLWEGESEAEGDDGIIYFVLVTGSAKYKDEPLVRYHFKQGIPGSKQLRNAANKAKFVYYEKGRFYAKGDIGDITSYEEKGVMFFYAEVKNYEKIGPIDFSSVRTNLSFDYVGAAGIRKISEQDFNTIIGTTAPQDQPTFIHEKLNLRSEELTFNSLLFEDDSNLKAQIHAALLSGKNIMLLGPPGTGKTEIALSLGKIASEKEYIHGFTIATATSDWTTFDTIGGYVPSKEGESFEFMPGQFLRCFREGKQLVNKWLIIDEINRSDIDKAFGQLFTVLSGQSVELPFLQDSAPIKIIPSKRLQGMALDKNHFPVPKSWRLLATLNTYDKASLYQMSYAFMRRFAFIHVPVPSRIFIETHWDKYLECWGIKISEALQACSNNIKTVWTSLNEDSKRPLGPAIIKDMLEFIVCYGIELESMNEDTQKRLLTDAVSSFILPQFEGLEKEDLIKLKNQLSEVCDKSKIEFLFKEMFEG